jgi:protocatechuate 3,4-dioxygenase alpha subunit
MPIATAQQTIGPYWHLIEHPEWADLTRFGAAGERITLEGRVLDGDGEPVADGAVEIFQADPPPSPTFPGIGRARVDAEGWFRFITLKPGPVRGRGNAWQAPHLGLILHARGILRPLFSRLYFAGDPRNETDPLLSSLPAERRRTLIASPAGEGRWRLDIRLQGADETVFLAL